jgi:NAD(P)-dependent dehydrogenase (short-subunit alcohol dehydrogenase family)
MLAGFGRTLALNVAAYDVSVNNISPGQRAYELVGKMPETPYGSEGCGVRPIESTA